MSSDLTRYATEGWDWERHWKPVSNNKSDADACPYLNTSDASNAWHLGREWARWGEARPTPDAKPRDAGRIVVTAGRGDIINVRGRADTLLRRFRVKPDNTFSEIRQ